MKDPQKELLLKNTLKNSKRVWFIESKIKRNELWFKPGKKKRLGFFTFLEDDKSGTPLIGLRTEEAPQTRGETSSRNLTNSSCFFPPQAP